MYLQKLNRNLLKRRVQLFLFKINQQNLTVMIPGQVIPSTVRLKIRVQEDGVARPDKAGDIVVILKFQR